MNTLLLVDYYKVEHYRMYSPGCTMIYSNLTPRKSRLPGIDKIVVFGLQYFIQKYLIDHFNETFFKRNLKDVLEEYNFAVSGSTTHVEKLHALGYIPLEIKALEEGTFCPIGVPVLTIKNTIPEFYWLTNYIETLLSTCIWQPMTSATIAHEYKKLLSKFALETTGSTDFVPYQGHDFSMRGMSSPESAIVSGMAHLTSFVGTDVIPAIYELRKYYGASTPAGGSVPATEHSVMALGSKENEIDTFKRLLNLYPTGILSVVSDTWDLWKVLTEYLPAIKNEVLARDGKLVIRPDSGDPVDILCGTVSERYESLENAKDWFADYLTCNQTHGECSFDVEESIVVQVEGKYYKLKADVEWNRYDKQYYFIESLDIKTEDLQTTPSCKGVIELLWDIFGGTVNEQGYKQLDSHIGAIYGDSITLDRAKQICERLKAKGFASTNIVLGIGSYTYQYNTRDTFGFAMKATYGEVTRKDLKDNNGNLYDQIEPREIFKDPITDDGVKKSKKGLLQVAKNPVTDALIVLDQQTWKQEQQGYLDVVFKDGKLVKTTTLAEIRERLNKQ